MQDFRGLKVWKKAHYLTLEVYKVTSTFPREELFGLTSQMRRASASIPANIAEGCGRGSRAELARFLQIAAGSATELQYHLILSRDLNLLKPDDYERLNNYATDTKRMLTRLIQKVLNPGSHDS